MAESKKYYDVFISYSRADEPRVKELVRVLESQDLNVWYDHDDIPKGANWRSEIELGIQSSLTFLFMISPDSIASTECANEVEIAHEEKKRFIPILYREISDDIYRKMHPAIGIHNWIFGRETDEWDETVEQIIRTIDTDIQHVRSHTHWNLRAQEWMQNKNDSSFLITGTELNSAEAWLATSAQKDPQPTSLHFDYISKSRQLVRARNRYMFSAVSGALVVMSILSVLIFGLYQQSLRQKNEISENLEQITSLALSSLQVQDTPNLIQRLAIAMGATSIENPPLQAWQSLAQVAYAPGPIRYSEVHQVAITDIVIAPDGLEIATVDTSGLIAITDINTGEILREFSIAENMSFNAVAYNPDGTQLWLAACVVQQVNAQSICQQSKMYVLSSETGQIIHELGGYTGIINEIIFTPDAGTVYTVSSSGRLVLHNTDGEQLAILEGHSSERSGIRDVDHFANSDVVLTAGDDETVLIWDMIDQLPIASLAPHDSNVYAVEITSNDQYVVSATEEGSIYVWDPQTLERLDYFARAHDDVITDIVSGDDNLILTSSWDGTIRMWQITNDTLVFLHELSGHNARVGGLELNLENQRAYSIGDNGSLIAWDIEAGHIVDSFYTPNGYPWKLDLSDDNQYLLSPTSTGAILLIDWQQGTIKQTYEGHTAGVRQAIFHPDQTRFLSASEDGTLRLWDIERAEPIHIYGDESNGYFGASFNSDGSQFIAGGLDGIITLWDVDTESIQATFSGHTHLVRAVNFLSDGQRFISASFDGTLRMWDIATNTPIQEYVGQGGRIISFAISPDESVMASTSDNQSLVLWDLESGTIIRELLGHRDYVVDVAFSSDGSRLVSSGWDGNIFLWDVESGSVSFVYKGHNEIPSSLVLTSDGNRIISVGGENENTLAEFIVWRVDSLTSLRDWTIDNRYVRPLTCEEMFLFAIPMDESCEN